MIYKQAWRNFENLTLREREIFKDMCEQLSTWEIAEKRDIALKTAKFHIHNIYRKMNVRSDDPMKSRRLEFNKMFLTFKPKRGFDS